MKKAIQTTLLSSDAIQVLQRACANARTRAAALRDPKAVLEKHGIRLPESVSLHLYERAAPRGRKRDRTEASENESILDLELTRVAGVSEPSPALEAWWRAEYMGCPLGTYPYKTTKKKTVCLVWGIAATGLEWVSLAEGTSYGYWRYTEVHRVCLASLEVDVEVIECLPLSVLTKA